MITMYLFAYRSTKDGNVITKSSGCKGSYSLMKLTQHDPMQQAIPDAMHTIKDAIVNLYDLITGKDDTIKCRKYEMNLGGCFGITASMLDKVSHKDPGVPYSLSSEDIKLADNRAQSILTPVHIGYVPGAIFTKTSNLKSHDWKQVYLHTMLRTYTLQVFHIITVVYLQVFVVF